MLKIRTKQIQSLERERIDQYVERVREHIAASYPDDHARLGDEGVKRLVVTAIETGSRHEIKGEGSVLALARLMIEFGERLELSPDQAWARTILDQPRMPGALKVQLIGERLRARTGGRRITRE